MEEGDLSLPSFCCCRSSWWSRIANVMLDCIEMIYVTSFWLIQRMQSKARIGFGDVRFFWTVSPSAKWFFLIFSSCRLRASLQKGCFFVIERSQIWVVEISLQTRVRLCIIDVFFYPHNAKSLVGLGLPFSSCRPMSNQLPNYLRNNCKPTSQVSTYLQGKNLMDSHLWEKP